jgi:uncharacterized YigZ family protein
MFDGIYNEINSLSLGLFKIKGSKFISYAYPVYSKKEINDKIVEVKRLENAARHYCFAYTLYPEKSIQISYDDGEPSSTAGKPILGQILSNDLTNILIVVARYFGGVKLGVSGLTNAYKSAAYDAILKAEIITKVVNEYYEVNFLYPYMNDVMRIVKEHKLEIINTNFEIKCKLIFAVEKKNADIVLNAFNKKYKLTVKYIQP